VSAAATSEKKRQWTKSLRPSHSGQKKSRQQAARLLICSGLARYQVLVSQLPRESRRKAIEALPQGLRLALLKHMEAMQAKTSFGNRPMQTSSAQKATAALGGSTSTSTSHIQGKVYKAESDNDKKPTDQKLCGCVTPIRISGHAHAFQARITIDTIAVNSRCKKSWEEANALREQLSQLRRLLPQDEADRIALLEQVFAGRCAPGGAAQPQGLHSQPEASVRNLAAALQEEPWSFRVIINLQATAGVSVTTRWVSSIREALEMRSMLEKAKAEGWQSMLVALAATVSQRKAARKHKSEPTEDHGDSTEPCDSQEVTPVRWSAGPLSKGSEEVYTRLHNLELMHAVTQVRRASRQERHRTQIAKRLQARHTNLEKRIARLASRLELAALRLCVTTN